MKTGLPGLPGLLAFLVTLAALAFGCDSGSPATAGDSGAGTDATMPPATMPGVVANDVPLPPMSMSTSDLLDEALAACERATATAERDIVSRCAFSAGTSEIVDRFAELHATAIGTRPLPGRGLEAFALPPAEITLAGDEIEIISCTANPLCPSGGPCPSMNAFALTNLVITLDPLLRSFSEGAAYWGTLVDAVGGDPDAVDPETLYVGLGAIYNAHATGRGYATVDEATVASMLESHEFAREVWEGVTAFLIMHEIGHADLGHGLINHTAAAGVQAVLSAEGRTLTAEETAQITAELRNLKVFTETQADIYAASLLRELGYSSDGPVVLFTAAMSAFLVASGRCDAAMTQEQLFDCAVAADPHAAHPPLDVRATVLRRIIDDGEDLSALLEELTPP